MYNGSAWKLRIKNIESHSDMSLVSVLTVAEPRDIIGLFSFISSQTTWGTQQDKDV